MGAATRWCMLRRGRDVDRGELLFYGHIWLIWCGAGKELSKTWLSPFVRIPASLVVGQAGRLPATGVQLSAP